MKSKLFDEFNYPHQLINKIPKRNKNTLLKKNSEKKYENTIESDIFHLVGT